MARLLIVQVLVALSRTAKGFFNCSVAFVEAQEYLPTRAEAEAELAKSASDPTFSVLFLSSGVFEITILPELSSFAPAAAQTRLICFPSVDAHHIIALRAEIQPSRLTFIEGIPPLPHNRWRQRIVSSVNRLDQIREAEVFATSTLNYLETVDCLLKLYAAHSVSERILIAPTGSKMQTVAVAIFRSFIETSRSYIPHRADTAHQTITRAELGRCIYSRWSHIVSPPASFPWILSPKTVPSCSLVQRPLCQR